MVGVIVTTAVAIFLGGIVTGVIAVIAVAVHREDRRYTLAVEAPDRMSRNARRLTGMARRDLDPEFLRGSPLGLSHMPRGPHLSRRRGQGHVLAHGVLAHGLTETVCQPSQPLGLLDPQESSLLSD